MANWSSLLGAMNSFALTAFGREVTYTPQLGPEFTVRVIFEAAREAEDVAPGVYAVAFLHSADLPASPERGDEIVVDGISYKVFDIEADHGGGVLLRLRRV